MRAYVALGTVLLLSLALVASNLIFVNWSKNVTTLFLNGKDLEPETKIQNTKLPSEELQILSKPDTIVTSEIKLKPNSILQKSNSTTNSSLISSSASSSSASLSPPSASSPSPSSSSPSVSSVPTSSLSVSSAPTSSSVMPTSSSPSVSSAVSTSSASSPISNISTPDSNDSSLDPSPIPQWQEEYMSRYKVETEVLASLTGSTCREYSFTITNKKSQGNFDGFRVELSNKNITKAIWLTTGKDSQGNFTGIHKGVLRIDFPGSYLLQIILLFGDLEPIAFTRGDISSFPDIYTTLKGNLVFPSNPEPVVLSSKYINFFHDPFHPCPDRSLLPLCPASSWLPGQAVINSVNVDQDYNWYTESDGYFYVPHYCRLKSYSLDEAHTCLTRFKRFEVTGDSLAREFSVDIGGILRMMMPGKVWVNTVHNGMILFNTSSFLIDDPSYGGYKKDGTRKWEDFRICSKCKKSKDLDKCIANDTCIEQSFRTAMIYLRNKDDLEEIDACIAMSGSHYIWNQEFTEWEKVGSEIMKVLNEAKCKRRFFGLLPATKDTTGFRFVHRTQMWNERMIELGNKHNIEVLDYFSITDAILGGCDEVHCGEWRKNVKHPGNSYHLVNLFLNRLCGL